MVPSPDLGGPRRSKKFSIVPILASLIVIQGYPNGSSWHFRDPWKSFSLLGAHGVKKVENPCWMRMKANDIFHFSFQKLFLISSWNKTIHDTFHCWNTIIKIFTISPMYNFENTFFNYIRIFLYFFHVKKLIL